MISRIAQRWYKTFMRRMIAKCGVRNPWRVLFSKACTELFASQQKIMSQLFSQTKPGLETCCVS